MSRRRRASDRRMRIQLRDAGRSDVVWRGGVDGAIACRHRRAGGGHDRHLDADVGSRTAVDDDIERGADGGSRCARRHLDDLGAARCDRADERSFVGRGDQPDQRSPRRSPPAARGARLRDGDDRGDRDLSASDAGHAGLRRHQRAERRPAAPCAAGDGRRPARRWPAVDGSTRRCAAPVPGHDLRRQPRARARRTRQIGTSAQGRPIMAVRFGDGPRTVLVVGQTHGDEEGGLRVLLRARSLPLPDGITLWVVPTMNPDGLIDDTRFLANGADPNRRAPSQPEQQAVHDFALAIAAVVDGLVPPELRLGGWFGRIAGAGEAIPSADRAGDVEAQRRLRGGVHVVPDRRRARQQLDPGRAARCAHARRRPGPCAALLAVASGDAP